MQNNRILRNTQGFSIVQVLVGAGIVSIVVAALTTAITKSIGENKYLEQKLAVFELQRTLTSIAPGVNLCAFALKNALPTQQTTFSAKNLNDVTLNIDTLSLDEDGKQILASVSKGNNGSSIINVEKMEIKQITPIGSSYVGDLVVTFTSKKPLKPLVYKMNLQTEKDEDNQKLTGCSSAAPTNTDERIDWY